MLFDMCRAHVDIVSASELAFDSWVQGEVPIEKIVVAGSQVGR